MKIGDRVRIMGTESGIEKEIVGITENGNYELSGDKIWEWKESELELIKEGEMKFNNEKYCDLIEQRTIISREIARLQVRKETIEKEMQRIFYEYEKDCEKDFEEV